MGQKKHSRKWIPLINGMEVCKSVSSSPLSVGLHSKSPQLMPENVDSTKPLYYSFSYTYIHFTASTAYPNCQHHYSCALGPLLCKIRVTGKQAPRYSNSPSDNQDGYQVTNGQGGTGPKDHSCPGQNDAGWLKFSPHFSEWHISWNLWIALILRVCLLNLGTVKQGRA